MPHRGPHSQPKQKERNEMAVLSYYFMGPKLLCGQLQFIIFCSSHQISFNKYLPLNSSQLAFAHL